MKHVLVVYTGFLFGLIVTALLYSLRSSLLDHTARPVTQTLISQWNRGASPPALARVSRSAHNNCFQAAIRCPDWGPCHCQDQCGTGFQDTVIDEDSEVIFLDQTLEPGTYCLPTRTVQCPRPYGYTLYDGSGASTCLCKYPNLYAGPTCSDRQVCHSGQLTHAITGVRLNEADIQHDQYRCDCDQRDKHGNWMIRVPGDQLNCVSDPCLRLMTNAPRDIGMNPDTGLCECGASGRVTHLYPGQEQSPCTPCFVSWVDETQVSIPLRCMYEYGIPHSAPPCRDFKTNHHQCDTPAPVKIQLIH